MNAKLLMGVGIILLVFGVYYRLNPLTPKVKVGKAVFTVDVAVIGAQKSKGLGGRISLDPNKGMLFPYDHTEQYEFWMKDMKFPLDFVWIRGKTVADIHERIAPPTSSEQPVIVKPKVAVDKVLELNAGTVAKYGINIGDSVEFLDK